MACILYLVKRIRTNALTVTSFLCTRVTKATEEDQGKLERLLGYLKAWQGKKLYIWIMGATDMQIQAFVDADFALHFDAKSHTGCVVTVGGAVVYVSSGKQKGMTASPTECELVALTDKLWLVGLFEEFVSFLIGRAA